MAQIRLLAARGGKKNKGKMIERNSGRPLGEDYSLQTPMNIYGMFLPAGTEYWKINADWWYPLVNGAILPAYAVHFTVIRNNETYFKLIEVAVG